MSCHSLFSLMRTSLASRDQGLSADYRPPSMPPPSFPHPQWWPMLLSAKWNFYPKISLCLICLWVFGLENDALNLATSWQMTVGAAAVSTWGGWFESEATRMLMGQCMNSMPIPPLGLKQMKIPCVETKWGEGENGCCIESQGQWSFKGRRRRSRSLRLGTERHWAQWEGL